SSARARRSDPLHGLRRTGRAIRRCARRRSRERLLARGVRGLDEPACRVHERLVRVTLVVRQGIDVAGERLVVAARDGASERAGGTELIDVVDRPPYEWKER